MQMDWRFLEIVLITNLQPIGENLVEHSGTVENHWLVSVDFKLNLLLRKVEKRIFLGSF